MNSLRHGLRAAELAVLPHEDPAEMSSFIGRWLRDLSVETDAEVEVGRNIALLRWRLRRIEEVESRRQQAEVLHRLDETDEKKVLDLVTNTINAIKIMIRAMESRLPESREELDRLLAPMAAVVKLLVQVEDSGPSIFVGATGFATAIDNLKALSPEIVSPLAYGEVVDRAHAAADAVRALLPDVEKMVELVKNQLSLELPMPGDRDVALRTRYRRDIEKRLESETRFLMLLRERRVQIQASGSLGQVVPG
jgi:hypothetical protein